ncbi:MAG TPA: PHP domain-containing protein [Jatrophihabitantaceae bacterium]|jgi:histidinol-phosphatase (PHP family)
MSAELGGSVAAVMLPADAHVHSEYSWDAGSDPASPGLMRRMCEHAIRIGLPAVVFSEHLDFETAWRVEVGDLGPHADALVDEDGYVQLPQFDLDGYVDAVERCRYEFPGIHILTGVEFGQPHVWEAAGRAVLASGAITRVNGSLHVLPFEGDRSEPITLYRRRPAEEVMWAYLDEIPRMVAGSDSFEVFAHIDYAVRTWPVKTAGPFDPRVFEAGFRTAMRCLAESGRALEMNTRRLWPWIPQWWAEEGGQAVTLGSDAHAPEVLAGNFPEATAMLEHFGFRPGTRPQDYWSR